MSIQSESTTSDYQSGSSVASISSVSSVLSEASQVPNASASGGGNILVGTVQVGAAGSSVKKEKKPGQGPKKERQPRLHLKKVSKNAEGTVAECIFDTYKNNTITFRFGVDDDGPDEIATNMVGYSFINLEIFINGKLIDEG